MQLRNVRANGAIVQGELYIEDLTLEPYPAQSFTPSWFPGLF
jgi:hypothetical protein